MSRSNHTFKAIFTLCLFVVLSISYSSQSQDLDRIFSGEKPLRVSGGINFNQVFYTASGIENRRDPYNFFLNGNLNLDIYGFAVPLSFTLSNQNASFQQPFNQFSLSPTYKNVRAHVGFSSLNFSKYTLAGHVFFGAGAEVTSVGKWSFAALAGRFFQAVEADTTQDNNNPSYRRFGYGFKVGYQGKNSDNIQFILFRARDDENSLEVDPVDFGVTPQENLVLSIIASKSITERLVVKAEVAGSALTRDVRSEEIRRPGFSIFNGVGPLFTNRTSSAFYNAFNTSLNYTGDFFTLGVNYERVDPEYETLGAYFFNNDLENITGNLSLNLFEQKVTVALNAGSQRNNLENTESNTLRRFVGSINVGYSPTPKATFAATYSNFQSFTNVNQDFFAPNQISPFENLDTLNFRQVSQNASLNGNFTLGNSKERRQNLNVNITFQNTADEQGGEESNTGNQFYNLNTSYTYSIAPKSLSFTASFNGNLVDNTMVTTSTLGPTVSASKSFFDRALRATLSSSFNTSFNNGKRINSVFNVRLGGNYKLFKKHNLNLNVVLLNRNNPLATTAAAFTEATATLGYRYSF